MPDVDTAPVAAPAADSSSAPTPSSSPEPTPSTPATPEAPKFEGGDEADYLSKVIDSKTKPEETVDPVAADAPVKEDPKVEEGDKPVESDPKDQPADEADDALSLEPDEILATSKLAQALKANPEAIAALEAAGIDKNSLFATARIAAKGEKVLGLFNGDIETAEHAAKASEQFGELTKMFVEARDVESTRGLLGKMREFSYVLDEDGNPVKDAQGNIQTDGSLDAFLSNIYQLGTTWHLDAMRKSGNPDYAAAADLMDQYLKSLSGSAPETPDYSQLDEATRARVEAADAREKQVADREAAEAERKGQEFEMKVGSSIEAALDTNIKALAKNAALTEGQEKWFVDQVKERVFEKVKSSRLFYPKLDALMRRPMGEKTMQARIAHGVNSARPLLKGVAREVFAELGVQISAKQQAASQKIAAQQLASRSEIKNTSKPAQPAKLSREEVVKNLTAKLGRKPSTEEYLLEVMS